MKISQFNLRAVTAATVMGAFACVGAMGTSPEAYADSGPHTSCESNYSHADHSLDISMYNGTDEPLSLDSALTGHYGSDEHWATQPPQTIAPGTCADMTGYSNMAVFGNVFALHAVYTMPNGDYVLS